jgi:secondary thiamine-phosphate synthase enzyme
MMIELMTYQKCAMVNITRQVRDSLAKSGIDNGLATVYCPHTTAGITINENSDPDVCSDILAGLEEMMPKLEYRHDEGNSPAHIKCLLTGQSVCIPVKDGELALGRWQGIYFCEFDGPRSRRFVVTVTAS